MRLLDTFTREWAEYSFEVKVMTYGIITTLTSKKPDSAQRYF